MVNDGSLPPQTLTTFNQEHLERDSMSTEWTDEKHSLYLKSMETSFVNDLYNSFDLLGYQVGQPSDPKSSRTSSGQFKVLRSGCWKKINFERNRSQEDKVDEQAVLLGNPWIRHFRSSSGSKLVKSPGLSEKVAISADASSYDSAEVTDQNFIDEEDTGEKTSHMHNAKRIKTFPLPTPSIDQVVPLANFSESADVNNKS